MIWFDPRTPRQGRGTQMRRKHMVDEKRKPGDISKETRKPAELSEEDLEKAAGGGGPKGPSGG